jgi:hypothetical protein
MSFGTGFGIFGEVKLGIEFGIMGRRTERQHQMGD